MKKLLFAILTATAIISVASCGGNGKSSDKKATTEQTTPQGNDQAPTVTAEPTAPVEAAPAQTVEEYAVAMFQQMYAVGEADDLATFTKLAKEFDAWINTLSDYDRQKAQNAVYAWDEEKADMVIDAANHVLGY